jgi:DNA modification methylase
MTPAPYYKADGITLYNADCLDVTAWLAADVLIADPPYGMAFQSGQRADKFDRIKGDDSPILRDNVIAQWRACGCNPPAAVFGTWRVPRPRNVANVLIWYKHGRGPGMGDLADVFGTCHEEIYLLGEWKRQPTTKRRGSVITTVESPSNTASRIGHPTPKPVGLMEQLIEATPPPAVIADPFAGSGSTLIAARNLGRRAIGIEIDERYCEIAAKRLDQMAINFEAGA